MDLKDFKKIDFVYQANFDINGTVYVSNEFKNEIKDKINA